MTERTKAAFALMSPCRLCPRHCRVDRLADERGFCGIGRLPIVASAGPHFGEEPPLVGSGGSGTIFFSGCNLRCIFCQNYDISHSPLGDELQPAELADLMLALQRRNCHNVNLVTPTHVTASIMEAIDIARERGLSIPIVYNCGGYESLETLRLLENYVQIYMPDAKYADPTIAERLSKAPDYPNVMKAALREMHRQVGDVQIINGIATRGLLVRHLLLPNGLAGTRTIIDFLADEISPNTYVNVMDQYRPTFQAWRYPQVNRFPTKEEFVEAYEYALRRGLRLA